ncbi:MAG: damage-control phosphatase ARMT1 family protein [Spirochaetota bacterium]
MRIYLDCIPCFARQAVEAAEMATETLGLREKIVREILRKSAEIPFDKSPPYMGMEIHRTIRGILGNIDPYHKLKVTYNKRALEYYTFMKELLSRSADRLETAVRIAVAGNMIDFGINSKDTEIDIKKLINETLKQPFAINKIPEFKKALDRSRQILYLTDNAGEIVFDRLLIEEFPDYKDRVIVAVKSEPVINDATMEDAVQAGLTGTVRVIENGSDAPGTILEECSMEFLRTFNDSDLIIAKGQGNYESLSEKDHNIFFLLKAKCTVIARDLGVGVGDIIVKSGQTRSI